MKYYTYEEALDVIEQTMQLSGIRDYCTKVCKGKCCSECNNSENACFKNEGRRISCSAFICSGLMSGPKIPPFQNEINRVIQDCFDECDFFGSVYFSFSQKAFALLKKSKFDRKVIDDWSHAILTTDLMPRFKKHAELNGFDYSLFLNKYSWSAGNVCGITERPNTNLAVLSAVACYLYMKKDCYRDSATIPEIKIRKLPKWSKI